MKGKNNKQSCYEYLIKDPDTGYRCLSAMVIKQAVVDYKDTLKNRTGTRKSKLKEDCIEFFKSDFCYGAIGIDGVDIMKQIERDVIKEKVNAVINK